MSGMLSSDKYVDRMTFSLGSREGFAVRVPSNFSCIILQWYVLCDIYFVARDSAASPVIAPPVCTTPLTMATPYPPMAALCSTAAIAGVPPTVDCKSANAPPD